MRILRVGDHAVLLELADGDEVDAWRAELIRRHTAGDLQTLEIVPGARTILLDGVDDVAATATLVGGWGPPAAVRPTASELIKIPVVYDGEDLAEVAAAWGTDEAGVVELLSGTELRVAFCGFSPGWGYLTGLPKELAMPRLDTPRQRVPAGSVALGGEYVGIYPTASPGGWRLVGRTEVTLFDITADPPALLTPGSRVRLVPLASPTTAGPPASTVTDPNAGGGQPFGARPARATEPSAAHPAATGHDTGDDTAKAGMTCRATQPELTIKMPGRSAPTAKATS